MNMLINIILFLMLILNLFWIKHPLSLGFNLMIQTINLSIFIGFMNKQFWFSYILLLILLSGMLVLFIYMASIASNEKFNTSNLMIKLLMYMLMMILLIIIKKEFFMNLMNYNTMTYYINMMTLIKIFNMNLNLSLMMILYLLIIMITVNYIINIFEGPMRKKN
uniref:NADH-ubiquinone oxidoreductase chain 6 n=1 Tax=Aenictopecheidae sp. PJ-2015 TaxID=1663421 RepID=A0A3S6C8I5_9HEMI|nr:NADH dehydrogenase subunit 6 [Aenictopecheidae sp. PJ-2015]